MHTVELLPDDELAHRVREIWDLLLDAGRPSLATNEHPTNRPHLTVVTAASLDGLPPLPLPVEASLGPARMLGRALVLEVTPTDGLRALHESVWSALPEAWPPPSDFVPHVSLALRVPDDQRPAALALLASLTPMRGSLVSARTYDTSLRVARSIQRGG